MSSAAYAVTRWIVPFLTVAAVAGIGLSAGTPQVASAPEVRLTADGANPLDGQNFYVNPNSKAMRAANGASSPQLTAIANTPTAYWMDNLSTPSVDAKYIADAQASGAMPILALYGIPHRDCGSFAAGGFGSGDAYKGWIDSVAADIGGGPAAVILEPDALAMADCLSAGQRQERFDLMRYAVDTLTRNPATAVYIDGGHSRWVSAEDMAGRLNDVGVAKARGFSLNTANFFTTEEEMGYGDAISGMTGGSHYVIDTSRNGAGPTDDTMYWCNPSGRALGAAPTTATGNGNVDAANPRQAPSSANTPSTSPATRVTSRGYDVAAAVETDWLTR
jgi:endoglucanase